MSQFCNLYSLNLSVFLLDLQLLFLRKGTFLHKPSTPGFKLKVPSHHITFFTGLFGLQSALAKYQNQLHTLGSHSENWFVQEYNPGGRSWTQARLWGLVHLPFHFRVWCSVFLLPTWILLLSTVTKFSPRLPKWTSRV